MQTYKRRISFSRLFKKGNSDILNYLPPIKDHFFTDSVRGGLTELIALIWKGEPGKVLLPVFLAEGVIKPFWNNKVPVIFYKLNEDLSPDVNDIQKKLEENPGIKSLVAIHYFGFAHDFSPTKELCDKYFILMFEDCVHALFSKDPSGNYMGLTGDICFFSFPKILPTPDGAVFFINKPDLTYLASTIEIQKKLSGFVMVRIHLIYLLIKSLETSLSYSASFRVLNFLTKGINVIYYLFLSKSTKPRRISAHTLRILKSLDYDQLIASRKLHIKEIYDSLAPFSKHIFSRDLNENEVLTGVPVIMKGHPAFTRKLIKKDIECLSYTRSWFFLPKGGETEFRIELDFMRNHFLLPIHEANSNYGETLTTMFSTLEPID